MQWIINSISYINISVAIQFNSEQWTLPSSTSISLNLSSFADWANPNTFLSLISIIQICWHDQPSHSTASISWLYSTDNPRLQSSFISDYETAVVKYQSIIDSDNNDDSPDFLVQDEFSEEVQSHGECRESFSEITGQVQVVAGDKVGSKSWPWQQQQSGVIRTREQLLSRLCWQETWCWRWVSTIKH